MADIRDKDGNPIQLTDQYGKPVNLTDEHGNRMHLTGVATTAGDDVGVVYVGTATAAAGVVHGETGGREFGIGEEQQQLHRFSSSSSSSSEDDGQGGRRKKGLKEKIKDKLTSGKYRDKYETATAHSATSVTPTTTTVGSATSTTTINHEKKGVMEKIKEKLPGHHPPSTDSQQKVVGVLTVITFFFEFYTSPSTDSQQKVVGVLTNDLASSTRIIKTAPIMWKNSRRTYYESVPPFSAPTAVTASETDAQIAHLAVRSQNV
ncbi:Embryogenic cell protein 40 [Forsythia ovata]|uniref:Embryogenic cell protein 40 n=1 Tax=Forsythia ovata TaxID=205694 RepID=A0ABD1VJV8_9LAMI